MSPGFPHVWLGLTAVPKKDRADLPGTPESLEGLFVSIYLLPCCVCCKRQEDETSQLSCYLLFTQQQVGREETRCNNAMLR